jgi:hypothetical protein
MFSVLMELKFCKKINKNFKKTKKLFGLNKKKSISFGDLKPKVEK